MAENWGYGELNGPQTWKNLFSIAKTGTRQSPIDINTKNVTHDPDKLGTLTVNYLPETDMEVVNTGHSIQAQITQKSEINGGPLKGTYRLHQFHLHWGSKKDQGSEHTIDGQAYDAELHLVHYNSSMYKTFGEAASQEDGLAVFGFLIKVGSEDAGFTSIVDAIPKVNKDRTTKIDTFNPACFLKDTKKYYTYKGSLTTPPLFESVVWIVFDDIMEISSEQMRALRSLTSHGHEIVDNFRPPQPIGTREVQCSF